MNADIPFHIVVIVALILGFIIGGCSVLVLQSIIFRPSKRVTAKPATPIRGDLSESDASC